MAQRVSLNNQAGKDVDAYFEYHRLVGDSDNGKMMSEKEFADYKQNLIKNQHLKLYVYWKNSNGKECKVMGPSTKCFCEHRFKEHDSMNKNGKTAPCKMNGCNCKCFDYIPVSGSQDLKCACKHSYSLHDPNSKKCKSGRCACPNGFISNWGCTCGQSYSQHHTAVESKQDRINSGKAVDDQLSIGGQVPLGFGGIKKFGDLVGYEDSYDKKLEVMGGVGGINNPQAPIGYNQMGIQGQTQKAIGGRQQQAIGQGYEQQEQQLQVQGQGGLMPLEKGVQGGISALTLFNTPHSFVSKTGGSKKMIKKY